MRYTDDKGDTYFFEFLNGGNCQTYVYRKANPSQVYYLWKKTKVTQAPSMTSVQRLLDDALYSPENMTVYESVIGDGFMSPGGLDFSKVWNHFVKVMTMYVSMYIIISMCVGYFNEQ